MATESTYPNDVKETGHAVVCPKCQHIGSTCKETIQVYEKGRTVRRRRCPNPECRAIFRTAEILEVEADAAVMTAEEVEAVRNTALWIKDSGNTTVSNSKMILEVLPKAK